MCAFPVTGWKPEAGFGADRGLVSGLWDLQVACTRAPHQSSRFMNILCWKSLVGYSFQKPLEYSRPSCSAGALHLRDRENRREFAKGKIKEAHDFTLCPQMFPPWASSSIGSLATIKWEVAVTASFP